MSIYTRTGDKGQTSLLGGKRVSKAHPRVETYGMIDELNSIIGAAVAHIKSRKLSTLKKELIDIQHDLLTIGSTLANPSSGPVKGLDSRVLEFEKIIDQLTNKLPALNKFIIPGGSEAGSLLHIARTVSRRAERRVVSLMQEEKIDDSIVKYVNRLSDLLFTMARYCNFAEKIKEKIKNFSDNKFLFISICIYRYPYNKLKHSG